MDKNLVIVGATGMIGGLVLDYALKDPAVGKVTTVGRRPTGRQHEKLTDIVHLDFLNWESLAEHLKGQHGALYCLGAYTGTVDDDQFRKITVDFTLAFGRVLSKVSPEATLCFLSGQGADPHEKSRIAFARYKGRAENALMAMGFGSLHLFRPGYIYPVTPRKEPNFSYRLMRWAFPLIRPLFPNIGLSSVDLARAMHRVSLEGTPDHDSPILENRDIRLIAAKLN